MFNKLNSATDSTQQAPNANNSADWQASMLVAPNPEQNSIQVCFTPAPDDFKFTVYIIQLIRLDSGSLNIVEQKQTVTPDSSVSLFFFFYKCSSCQERLKTVSSLIHWIFLFVFNF